MNNHRSLLSHAVVLVASAAVLFTVVTGCDGGHIGDRCNPDLSHNDCDDGLTCIQPSTCVENYCCPSNPSSSSNPVCNGTNCPPASVDSGPATSSEAGSD